MSPLRPLIVSQPAVLVSLAVALILTVGTALLGVVSTRRVVEANALTADSHGRIIAIQQTLTALADVETGQRGYLLTGDEKYLQPYRQALGRIDPLLGDLRRQYAKQPERLGSVERVLPLIAEQRCFQARTKSGS